MKFNVVIGNPPYNRDIFLEFIGIGHSKSDKYCVMITPAKWQSDAPNARTLGNITYGGFREKYLKYISHVIFYPACRDIFDIYQTDGITITLMDNNTHEKVIIQNICKDIQVYNSTETREIGNRESLLNIGNEIINSIKPYKQFKFPLVYLNKKYRVFTNTKISGYDWFETKRPRFALGISRIIDANDRLALMQLSDYTKCTFESDNIQECEAFVSWLNSRFVRFFLAVNMSKLTGIITDDCFRFVPALPEQYKYDHLYTDEELYSIYNLSDKYIKVIESLIRKRD